MALQVCGSRIMRERQEAAGSQSKPAASLTVSDEETNLMLKRVANLRAGRCPALAATGSPSDRNLFESLGLMYTKLSAPLKVTVTPRSGVSDPSAHFDAAISSMESEQLWPDAAKVTLAGRAVAIVVNPRCKLDGLQLEQVQAIFGGQATDWKILAAGDGAINCYGLRPGATIAAGGSASLTAGGSASLTAGGSASDPSAMIASGAEQIFYDKVVALKQLKGVTLKKSSAEVLMAVALDPHGIGFVDLTAIPDGDDGAKKAGVKVLRIGSASLTASGGGKTPSPRPSPVKGEGSAPVADGADGAGWQLSALAAAVLVREPQGQRHG